MSCNDAGRRLPELRYPTTRPGCVERADRLIHVKSTMPRCAYLWRQGRGVFGPPSFVSDCAHVEDTPHPLTMNPYAAFVLYLVAILGFVGITLLLNRLLGPKPVSSAIKLEPFECGATPIDSRNVKAVPIKYYAVAIAFMLFDLETVFLYIWALGAQPLTGFMLVTFCIFVFLLVAILLYVYSARLLEAVTE